MDLIAEIDFSDSLLHLADITNSDDPKTFQTERETIPTDQSPFPDKTRGKEMAEGSIVDLHPDHELDSVIEPEGTPVGQQ